MSSVFCFRVLCSALIDHYHRRISEIFPSRHFGVWCSLGLISTFISVLYLLSSLDINRSPNRFRVFSTRTFVLQKRGSNPKWCVSLPAFATQHTSSFNHFFDVLLWRGRYAIRRDPLVSEIYPRGINEFHSRIVYFPRSSLFQQLAIATAADRRFFFGEPLIDASKNDDATFLAVPSMASVCSRGTPRGRGARNRIRYPIMLINRTRKHARSVHAVHGSQRFATKFADSGDGGRRKKGESSRVEGFRSHGTGATVKFKASEPRMRVANAEKGAGETKFKEFQFELMASFRTELICENSRKGH
ncbi:hypothetical protein L596_007953 [Steinernema carpocapsae]|uniref:Uncharacterized protein n=1 Tax=Steinernema carpocapsae TaxID=34508 RepID=A0A4U5PB28_STECR|nr:hypothetical protein L596_007953 [Steinernema carpocapsae]